MVYNLFYFVRMSVILNCVKIHVEWMQITQLWQELGLGKLILFTDQRYLLIGRELRWVVDTTVSDKMVETLTLLLGMVTTWVADNFRNPCPLSQKWEALESATATTTPHKLRILLVDLWQPLAVKKLKSSGELKLPGFKLTNSRAIQSYLHLTPIRSRIARRLNQWRSSLIM